MGSLVAVEVNVAVPVPVNTNNDAVSQPGMRYMNVGENKLVEEAIVIKKEKIFKDLNKAINKMQKIRDIRTKNREWNINLLKSVSVFFETHDSIKNIAPLRYDLIRKYLCEAGQQLSKTKSISKICKMIIEYLKVCYKNKEGETDTHQFEEITQSFLTLMNYSDCTPEVTYDIAAEQDFLETIKGFLSTIFHAHMYGEAKEEDEKIMKWCLTFYYNTSIVEDNIPRLRKLDIVPVFSSFLDAKVNIYRLTALSTLANIIDEKESTEILQDKPEVVKFLIQKLGLALEDLHHRHLGWSAEECARTVRRLARNDANKKLLVQIGCLPHLFKLAKQGSVSEQREAVGAIYFLAFEEENHSSILNDTKLIDLLEEIKDNSSDIQLRLAADGTLFRLREELEKKKDQQAEPKHVTPVKDGRGHIMISYNWGHQKQLIQIKDILKERGYAVWMDIENMSGSTMQAMAEAVEQADIILVCMSQKYKDSPNCRQEAEYAYAKKKTVIPLKMERDYNPDGWLGFLAGAKLFFDFSGKYPFEDKIKELIREIAISYGDEDAKPKVVPTKS